MMPADVAPSPPEEKAVSDGWQSALERSLKKHAGESLPTVQITSEKESELEALDGQSMALSGPTDERMFETPLVRVVSNFVGDTYNLNVEPRHPKRPWRQPPAIIGGAIAQHLDKVVPKTLEVIVRPPRDDWEILLYTFKVPGLKSQWNVPLDRLPEIEKRISEELQAYC